MPFSSLGLAQPILRALSEEGYEKPTAIQAQAIPPIIAGRDMLGCAQTGTGKTGAFALPVLHRLLEIPIDKTRRGPVPIRVLVLSPTRELAAQIGESFATYGRHSHLTHAVVFGGVSQHHQVRALRRGVDVLVATPGRLMDLMEQGYVDLNNVGIFILDEADRMLEMGFIQPIRQIAASLPSPRQTLLFSATMPKIIMHLAEALLRDPVRVTVTPAASSIPLIEQSLYHVHFRQKQALLEHILDGETVTRAIVFTKTKHGADKVCDRLEAKDVSAIAIHGNKAQNFRIRALEAFRSGRCRVLVATDVAARGLDVDDISHVINFDLPMEPEAYVHRIGRTGRAGATGVAISFCDSQERDLLRQIQKLTGKPIPVVSEMPVLPAVEGGSSRGDDRGGRGGFGGGGFGGGRGGRRSGNGAGNGGGSYGSAPRQERPPADRPPVEKSATAKVAADRPVGERPRVERPRVERDPMASGARDGAREGAREGGQSAYPSKPKGPPRARGEAPAGGGQPRAKSSRGPNSGAPAREGHPQFGPGNGQGSKGPGGRKVFAKRGPRKQQGR